jgi:hypothetical protein
MPDSPRAVAEALLGLYDDPGASIEFATPYRVVGALAHGWYTTARRTAGAILLLIDAGYGAEAAPLRRCLTEHAVGLRWLAEEGEAAARAVLSAYRKWVARQHKAVTTAGWDAPEEAVVTILATADPAVKDIDLKLGELVARWGSETARAAWLYDTQSSHLTYTTAHRYVVGEDLETAELAHRVVNDRTGEDLRDVVATLLLATEAFNRLLIGQPWTDQIKAVELALRGWTTRPA